jgi:hypothetical protein
MTLAGLVKVLCIAAVAFDKRENISGLSTAKCDPQSIDELD